MASFLSRFFIPITINGIMWQEIVETVRSYPQIAIFTAIAIGYYIGKIKVFGFSFGSTAGVLLAALVLGQMNIEVSSLLKSVAFALFIFTIGYKVGPQFFSGLKKDGLNYLWLSLFVGFISVILAILLGKFFGFGKGLTAGLLGGALTQSAVIGTAEGAIKHLPVSGVQKTILESNVAVAYAITYIFGTAGLIVFYKIVPKLLRIDLKSEAKKVEQELSGASNEELGPEFFNWSKRLNLRVYKFTNKLLEGKTIRELESAFKNKVAVDKLKRDNKPIDFEPNTLIKFGDIVAITGLYGQLIEADKVIGPEIDDKETEDITGEVLDVCVLKNDAVGKTLGDISKEHGHGCFLRRITRQGHELPLAKNTLINKCDVLRVAGAQKDVEKLVQYLGYPERPTITTDLIMVGLGCALGSLLGLIALRIASIPLTLGVGGGVLIAGLVFGYLRAVHPTFGQIPSGAQWIFTDLGLNLFIACIGLIAGPKAINSLATSGGPLFLSGVILTLVTHIAGIIFGMVILKLNPVLLFGALTGSGTATPALNALKEEAESAVPAIGYTVCYAFGNVILTIWGAVIVSIM